MWSAGVILYLLLTGKPPFSGGDAKSIFANAQKGEFSLKEREFDNTSEECIDLIKHMIELDVNKRFSA